MAKLSSPNLELIAVRGMCSKDPKVSGSLLAQLDDTHFHSDAAKDAYALVLKSFTERGQPPTWTVLVESPALSKETRRTLRDAPNKRPRETAEVEDLVGTLNRYRHTRIFYELCANGMEMLQASNISTEKMVKFAQAKLAGMMVNKAVESQMSHVGVDGNLHDAVHEIIHGEATDMYIPTGWRTFDRPNGGIPRGALFTLGGASSAGKSHIVVQLAKTQAYLGYKVAVVPLEMNRSEVLVRLLANISGIDSLKINLKRLATDEKAMVEEAFRKYDKKARKRGGRLTFYNPSNDVTIEETLSAVHAYNPDIIYIDYIGLLAGASGDDQWRSLGNICRAGKVWAGNHNKVCALACQVDDDGRIRYSQAIKEHSSLAFTFVATRESREAGYLNLKMLKGRNQMMMDFALKIDYSTSTLTDMDGNDTPRPASEQEDTSPKKKKGKGGNPRKRDAESFVPDLDE